MVERKALEAFQTLLEHEKQETLTIKREALDNLVKYTQGLEGLLDKEADDYGEMLQDKLVAYFGDLTEIDFFSQCETKEEARLLGFLALLSNSLYAVGESGLCLSNRTLLALATDLTGMGQQMLEEYCATMEEA